MKLTFQELNLLCALAERLGWIKPPANWVTTYDTLPPTYYRVDDLTQGIDVSFRFLRSRPSPGMSYSQGDVHPIWWVVFEPWNPLESLDDAWVLVNAMAQADQDAKLVFNFVLPQPSMAISRQQFARGICLAAAKAWGIQTELTP